MTRLSFFTIFVFPFDVHGRPRRTRASEAPKSRLFCPETLSPIAARLTDLARSSRHCAIAPHPSTAEIDIAVHR